jgi:pyridinium-3,5-bisthiocarboxylic acid mononucleotide nickel chelatase
MRIAYLDCFSGISGDMFLGALIDAGVSPNLFEQAVAALGAGAKLEISRVNRSGISATKVDVVVAAEKDSPGRDRTLPAPPPGSNQPSHRHARAHSRAHQPAPDAHDSRHHQQHGRGLAEIREIISEAALSPQAKRTAIAIFERLGGAEAKIHNVPVEKIHFHELGAVDALVDITCAAVGSEALGVDEIICSPLNVGGGTVTCAHGRFPVPAPATVELLTGAPVYSSGIQAELATPTGAAIVSTLASRFGRFPAMQVEKVGYGAGARDLPGHANVLRITIGSAETDAGKTLPASQLVEETISVLEANLDDLNPQVFGYVIDRLLEAGALEVFGTPVQMKKNRPGTLLTVLAKPTHADALAQIIFAETTTLGIRRREEHRHALNRRWQSVSTRFGDVRMKIASMNGSITSYAPEYEDCRRIAAERRVPLKMVMQEAVLEYLRSAESPDQG